MGLMGGVLGILFGPGKNVVRETAEVFRENAEAASARDSELQRAAIEAFAAEFAHARKGVFDRFMDGLNRVPRPALAISTLGLFGAAMASPDWFALRMQSIALVPEPLWWLMGVIVSFYFGARHQMKGQQFQRSIAETLALGHEMRRAQTAQITPAEKTASVTPPAPLNLDNSAKPTRTNSAQVVPKMAARKVNLTGKVNVEGNAALADWNAKRHGR